MEQMPMVMGQMLLALDMHIGPMYELALLGDATEGETADVLSDLRSRFIPNRVLACCKVANAEGGSAPDLAVGSAALDELFAGKEAAAEPRWG